MNKSMIMLAAVPILCGAVGYGAGFALKPAPVAEASAEAAPAHADAAEVLDKLAETSPEAEHPAPVPAAKPADDHAEAAPEAAHEVAAAATGHATGHAPIIDAVDDTRIVQVGRISVPVYKSRSVTYVIADFGVAVESDADVAKYSIAENAARLRDAILTSMHRAAETPILSGPAIDSEQLAEAVATDLRPSFEGVKDILFLSLHKTDVPRS